MTTKIIKLFLRFSIAASFLSAVADRFGFWPADLSVWGNWDSFLEYTQHINPWMTTEMVAPVGVIATAAEVVFALCLIIGFKTELVARLSGYLLLIFALSMTFSTGIKGAFDYSVFTAAAAAFALSRIKEKHWELDKHI